MSDEKKKEMWAIVELFGHQRIAGLMTEEVIAGQGFVRIDVPEIAADARAYGDGPSGLISAHSKLFGPGAIYSINPVDEAVAKAAAAKIRHAPVMEYGAADVLRSLAPENRRRLLEAPEDRS